METDNGPKIQLDRINFELSDRLPKSKEERLYSLPLAIKTLELINIARRYGLLMLENEKDELPKEYGEFLHQFMFRSLEMIIDGVDAADILNYMNSAIVFHAPSGKELFAAIVIREGLYKLHQKINPRLFKDFLFVWFGYDCRLKIQLEIDMYEKKENEKIIKISKGILEKRVNQEFPMRPIDKLIKRIKPNTGIQKVLREVDSEMVSEIFKEAPISTVDCFQKNISELGFALIVSDSVIYADTEKTKEAVKHIRKIINALVQEGEITLSPNK